jgi:RNA polymerase sigma-70 factor (ECF subfamily)
MIGNWFYALNEATWKRLANWCVLINRPFSMSPIRAKTTNVVTDIHYPGQEPVTMDSSAQSRPLPEQTAISRETAERIRAAILQLPPQYRAVIELRHFQDLSYDEMPAYQFLKGS